MTTVPYEVFKLLGEIDHDDPPLLEINPDTPPQVFHPDFWPEEPARSERAARAAGERLSWPILATMR